jgi:hypothetical protein
MQHSACPKPWVDDCFGHHIARSQKFLANLRQRYFGPRDLTSDGIYRSKATTC